MALDRTWFNALVDDDGSGLTGSVWDKADIANLLNSVDSELARLDTTNNAGGAAQPYCSVDLINGNGQSIPSGANTLVLFDRELSDSWNMWIAAAPGRITVPVTGVYLVEVGIFWDTTPATGARSMTLRLNGTAATADDLTDLNSTTYTFQKKRDLIVIAAGGFLEVTVYQTSGSSTRIGGFGGYSTNYLKLYKLGM